MTLMIRLFGRRIEGEELMNLVEAMGRGTEGIFNSNLEKWTSLSPKGKVRFSPNVEGINVDLYVVRKRVHRVDGSISGDYSIISGQRRLIPQEEVQTKDRAYLTGIVPYSHLNQQEGER